MGDGLLMKRVVISSIMIGGVLFANNPTTIDKEQLVKEYQEMFKKISQKRVGLDESKIVQVHSPFVKIVKNKKGTKSANTTKKVQNVLTLDAILGKSAMINGKWYKLYQKVGDMKIVAIRANEILLRNSSETKKLKIRTKNENIKIK